MPDVLSSLPRILFVDDDADVQRSAAMLLPRRGFELLSARSPQEAWSLLGTGPVDVVLLDLNFSSGATSGAEGFSMLQALIAHDPDMIVVIVTGHSGINIAVSAMRAGAADFVMKPWSNERLVTTLNEAVALRHRRRGDRLGLPKTDEAEPERDETPVIGESPAIRRVLELMRRTAATDAPILLIGDAGTGKSLLAHTIHRLSPRAARPLVIVDPAAVWETGEGGLTVAFDALDDTGSLFLDEVGSLPPPLQTRLLTLLQNHPSLRLIAATRQPRDLLQQGSLHPDLLYHLNTVELALPRLRERGDDVRLLAAHYLRLFARRYGRSAMTFSPEADAAIVAHEWTGNVRALRQAVERAVVLAQHDILRPEDIPLAAPLPEGLATALPGQGDLNLARSEKAIVEAALKRHGFNVSHAAKELGLTRAALYRRMARHGL